MTPNTWKALLSFAGKKDVRYYLNGIHIDAQKRVAVATNGHILLVCKLDANDVVAATVTIPRDHVENAVKLKDCALNIAANSTIHMGQLFTKPIHGKYPDWLRVVPETTSSEYSSYDWDYISTLNEAGRLITGKKQFNMKLHMNGRGPALAALGDKALAVVMPMREGMAHAVDEPKWLADMQAAIRKQ